MEITRENTDDLNAILKIKIDKADYENRVENVLKDYRKKANIKGFRPGMVPIGVIRKMYGNAVKVDEINKIISENIHNYLTDEKLEILGDPLPKTEELEDINYETQEDFIFSFELGLAPDVELNISKKNKVTSYDITIDEKMKNDHVENYRRRFGEYKNADVSEVKDVLKGKIEYVDGNSILFPEGHITDDSSLAIDIIRDDKIKKNFIGKKANDKIDFDLRKAFPNDNEIAGLLKMQKEEVKDINGKFRFTISEISRFFPAEIGTDLFDKIYGEGVISTEDDFMKKIEEEISASLERETEYKLMLDIKDMVIEKTDLKLPEDFLKRWLLKVNKNTTEEQIEKEFDNFRKDLRWQLIKNKIARDNDVKITQEELQIEAEKITRYQFQQYGLFYATDEQISNYARETLKKEDDAKRIADKILDDKVFILLKDIVKIETKKITSEKFNKLFE
jgi:trigger factor